MVTRQGFEHQKDINLEAYTLGLVQRVDINFRIDYKGGVLDSVSQLPTTGNSVNDAFFVRDNINNRVYIWDGAAWIVDQASTGGGGVEYTTAPTTTGNRIVQSIGVNADLIEETAIEVDPLTGDILFPSTIEVTFESDVNNIGNTITSDGATIDNINGTVINNTGTIINNVGVTENYNDTPTLISCEAGPFSFATPYTAAALTQYAEVEVTFDNGVDGPDTKIIQTSLDSIDTIANFVSGADVGSITISWTAGDIQVVIDSGNALYFTIDAICRWNGVSVNNYTNKIHNHNGGIFNYSNVTQNYESSQINMDQNSSFVNEGNSIFENATIENLLVNNFIVGPSFDASDLISADAGNQLVTGTDDLLYVPVPSFSGNLIAPGTDISIQANNAEKIDPFVSQNGTLANATLMKSIEVNKEFLYNISFEGRSSSGANSVTFAIIINGTTSIGTFGPVFSVYTVFTSQYYGSIGDTIDIYYWSKSGGSPDAYVRNFNLLATPVEDSTGIATNIVV